MGYLKNISLVIAPLLLFLAGCGQPEYPEPDNQSVSTVKGAVTDTSGRYRGYAYLAPAGSNIWRGTQSDAKGRFVLENVSAGQKTWAAYSHHSETMGLFMIPDNYDGREIQVVLHYKAAQAEGRVLDGNGKGLAGRKVEVVIHTRQGITYSTQSYSETDKFGNYSCSPVPTDHELTIEAKLADANETECKYITQAVALSDNQIFIEMPALVIGEGKPKESYDGQVLCSGRIVNEENKPIEGVVVELMYEMNNYMGSFSKKVMTDKNGRWHYRLPADYSGLGVRLFHPDYISYHFEDSDRTPTKTELLDGSNVMIMKQGLRISGTVCDSQGKPIENALVAAGRWYSSPASGGIVEDCTTARTLSDGSFSIGGLPEKQIEVEASGIGFTPKFFPVKLQQDMKPLKLILEHGWTYRGQVVDKDGKPIEGVDISHAVWRIGHRLSHPAINVRTDPNGYFNIEDVPNEGSLAFIFGKKQSDLQHFMREMPEDLSKIDRLIMYKTPVFAGKVIDSQTEKPVSSFAVVCGAKWEKSAESISWAGGWKESVTSDDGTFKKTWTGYLVFYPFDGECFLKIIAKGYLPAITPPVELGKDYEPFVISLTKAEPLRGTIIDSDGKAAVKAQVGWIGPDEKAYIKSGRFDGTKITAVTDANGQFEVGPFKKEGLILALHEKGYASIESRDFKSGSSIKLTPWSRIEGTVALEHKDSRQVTIRINPIVSSEQWKSQKINWWFDPITVSGRHFVIEHIPSIPLQVGQQVRWEQSNSIYLKPQPDQTYNIQIGGKGRTVLGKIICPPLQEEGQAIEVTMSDPRQVHAAAFRIDSVSELPQEFKDIPQNSFLQLWRDSNDIYAPSKSFEKRFVPDIYNDGSFNFDAMLPGKYEFIVNVHAPLGENVSCGRGILKAVGIGKFTVDDVNNIETVHVPDIKMISLAYPEIGDVAPDFNVDTVDGKIIRLKDLRGKVVLLDFWATWCLPCIDQIPKLKNIYNTFANRKDFVMISLSVDWDTEKAKNFVNKERLNWPQMCLGDMSESIVAREYGVSGIPAVILIDPNGRIAAKNLSAEQLETKISKMLKF